jgi:rubrerythrin
MSQWQTTEEILDFAIKNEEAAAQFYKNLGEQANLKHMREAFEEFAREELRHKAKLMGVRKSGTLEPASKAVLDLKIGDYLVNEAPSAEMDYQQALILAMKQEKAAFKLYNDLAAATADSDLRELLLGLAQEEAKHKLRFEVEYDDVILAEN